MSKSEENIALSEFPYFIFHYFKEIYQTKSKFEEVKRSKTLKTLNILIECTGFYLQFIIFKTEIFTMSNIL